MTDTSISVLEAGGIGEIEKEMLFKRYSKPAILNLILCAELLRQMVN